MSGEDEVYQFIYGKRNHILKSVNIYNLRAHFGTKYSEKTLQDILSSLVKIGKVKTNDSGDGKGLISYWVRTEPDKYMPEEENGGFLMPFTPSHSLQLLNNYMRTGFIKLVHGLFYEHKEIHPNHSPLKHLIYSIGSVLKLTIHKNKINFQKLEQNTLHHHPTFEFDAVEDFDHDIKLLNFHLKALLQIHKSNNGDTF